MRVAVVGATGLVGQVMLKVLEQRHFPVEELLPVASERSVGKTVQFEGQPHRVRSLTDAGIVDHQLRPASLRRTDMQPERIAA